MSKKKVNDHIGHFPERKVLLRTYAAAPISPGLRSILST